jgi:hypothetical protein
VIFSGFGLGKVLGVVGDVLFFYFSSSFELIGWRMEGLFKAGSFVNIL